MQVSPPVATHGATTVNGASIHYRHWGSGPPVYLIHGGPGGSGSYWPVGVPWLGERHEVFALDLRGHGLSERAPPYSVTQFADDIRMFADRHGHERYTIVGHSFGSLVAMAAAIDDPHVRALVLIGGFPHARRTLFHPRGLATKMRLLAMILRWKARRSRGAAEAPRVFLVRLLREARPLLQHKDADADRIEKILADSVTDPLDAVPRLQGELIAWDRRKDLPRIRCPTLVITGTGDALGGPADRSLARGIPHAKLVRVPRAGHSPFFDRPEEFRHEVERFLAGVPS